MKTFEFPIIPVSYANIHDYNQGKPYAGDVCDGKSFWLTEMIVNGKKRDLGSLSPTLKGDLGVFKSIFCGDVVMIPVKWLDNNTDEQLDIMLKEFILKRYKELKREAGKHQRVPLQLRAALRKLESIRL